MAVRSTASVLYIPNLATSRNNVSGISIAAQGDRVEFGATVPVFDGGTTVGEGSLGLKIRLMMALMMVILIWTDRRRERKMVADAWGLIVFGRVAVESWV